MAFTPEENTILNELSWLFARFIYKTKGYDYLNQLSSKKLDEMQEEQIYKRLRDIYNEALKFRELDDQAALTLAEEFVTTFRAYHAVKKAVKPTVAEKPVELSDVNLRMKAATVDKRTDANGLPSTNSSAMWGKNTATITTASTKAAAPSAEREASEKREFDFRM